MNSKIRQPKQKRATEKKENIVKAGWELISKNGYYNTNTKEIAKEAGVSTGIVYQYFKDKHDILIEGINKYGDEIFYPMLKIENKEFTKDNFLDIIKEMINDHIKEHKISKDVHEEIMAMVHMDKDVAKYFYKREMDMTNKIHGILLENNITSKNLKEKVHIMIGMIDNLCHEVIYHKHEGINYKIMTDIVIKNINTLINDN